MQATIIDGKQIAAEVRSGLRERVEAFVADYGSSPGLAVVLVGDNPASHVYVRMKERGCNDVGIRSEKHHLPADTTQDDLIRLVRRLGARDDIDGILVQMPLPRHISDQSVLAEVDPAKDVDGFHPINAGKLASGARGIVPCTPAGIIEMIRRTGLSLQGKEAVVVGRSNIVGKPTALLLLQENATVTLAHSRTANLKEVCRRADVLVVAIGRPYLITSDYVKPGAAVIDVGVNRLPDGGLVGDVDFDDVKEVAGYLTPVPGGVGPMTIAMLLQNTLDAAIARRRRCKALAELLRSSRKLDDDG